MPRYPCTRCGEAVDTGPSFAPPLNLLCPDCRGEAPNPPEPVRQAPAPPIPRAPLRPSYAAAPPPLPSHLPGRGFPWWAGVLISHLLAGGMLCIAAIPENEKDPIFEGTVGGVLLGLAMLLLLDGISLVVGLIGAGILRVFKLHFGRSLAHVFSIFLTLSALVVFVGSFLPEELEEEGESALPKVEAVE